MDAPRDADGRAIKVGDRLQITGSEDKPITVDGMVTLPTYYSESAGRSCAVVMPERWHVVDGDGRDSEDSWERIESDIAKDACDYFGHDYKDSCLFCKAFSSDKPCDEVKAHDIVRRCRELAKREVRR